jgi:hypothetical protein
MTIGYWASHTGVYKQSLISQLYHPSIIHIFINIFYYYIFTYLVYLLHWYKSRSVLPNPHNPYRKSLSIFSFPSSLSTPTHPQPLPPSHSHPCPSPFPSPVIFFSPNPSPFPSPSFSPSLTPSLPPPHMLVSLPFRPYFPPRNPCTLSPSIPFQFPCNRFPSLPSLSLSPIPFPST